LPVGGQYRRTVRRIAGWIVSMASHSPRHFCPASLGLNAEAGTTHNCNVWTISTYLRMTDR
jgi:hypothetical protein